ERIRRNGEVFQPVAATVLEAGDSVALLGRTESLVTLVGSAAPEVADAELLDIPVASFDIYVTDKRLVGKTLEEIAHNIDQIRGIFLRGILRNSKSIPIGVKTVVELGDIVQVTGPEAVVEN